MSNFTIKPLPHDLNPFPNLGTTGQKIRDLTCEPFPHDLNWSSTERFNSLQRLFAFADRHCDEAIKWYNHKKGSKQKLGSGLRLLSILAVAAAGIMPLISELSCRRDGGLCINPTWATVFLALAALFIAIDRFAGYTSGWVRYVRSAQRLTQLQGQFRLDWCLRLNNGVDGSIEQHWDCRSTKDCICLCKEYIDAVNSLVCHETNIWAQEFLQILLQSESAMSQGRVVQTMTVEGRTSQDQVVQAVTVEGKANQEQLVQAVTVKEPSDATKADRSHNGTGKGDSHNGSNGADQ